jgi:hypothetical protein
MTTPFVLFARTFRASPYTDTTLYLWGRPGRRGQRVSYCKLLCYRTVNGKEYTYSIVPRGAVFVWRVKQRTGVSDTFALAWAHMPLFLKYPTRYHDSPQVSVPHTGITTLQCLWQAERMTTHALSVAESLTGVG